MSADESPRSVLRRAAIFRGVRWQEFRLVESTMRRRVLERGERLFEQGETGDSMHVVAQGSLAILVRDSKGRENAISRVQTGDVVGEMTFLDPQPRSASVAALGPAVVYELDRHLLGFLRADAPAAAAAIVGGVIQQLSERLRDTNVLIEGTLSRLTAHRRQAAAPAGQRLPAGAAPARFEGELDLRVVEMLRGLTARDLEILSSVAPPRRYADRAVFCHEGDPGVSCFLVIRGQVDVLRYMRGRWRRLATLAPGALVGQLALVDRALRSASIRARGPVVALELARDDFERLLAAASPLALRFQEEIAVSGIRQLRMANQRCVQLFDKAKVAVGAEHVPTVPQREPEPEPEARPARPRRAAKRKRAVSEMEDPLTYVQTALREWGMSLDDLDKMEVVQADGLMSAAELVARKKRF